MSYECKYCKKKLSTKSSLTLHQKTTVACLNIQESMNIHTNNTRVICDYCKQSFTKNNLSKHLTVCKLRNSNEINVKDNEIATLKEQITVKDSEISRLKEQIILKDKEISSIEEGFLNRLKSHLKTFTIVYNEYVICNRYRSNIVKISDSLKLCLYTIEQLAKYPNTDEDEEHEDEEHTCCD